MTFLTFIWPLWFWPSTYLKNVSNGNFLLKDNNCAKLFLKSMHNKRTSYGLDKLFWLFWPLFDPWINVPGIGRTSSIYDHFDLIWPLWPWPSTYLKNVSNGTFPPRGQQLCKFILKSMHKSTSYGQDKLIYDHFDPYLTPMILTFNLPENVSNGTFLLEGNNCAKLFWNPCIINVQVMAWISFFDHFDLYLIHVTLTFNLYKCFKGYFSSSRATTVPNCFEIHA